MTGSVPLSPSTTDTSPTDTAGTGPLLASLSLIVMLPEVSEPTTAFLTLVMRTITVSSDSAMTSPSTFTTMLALVAPILIETDPVLAVKSSPAVAVPPSTEYATDTAFVVGAEMLTGTETLMLPVSPSTTDTSPIVAVGNGPAGVVAVCADAAACEPM